jgi:DNA mismatch repair protein MutL
MKIHELDSHLINKIAAGEVIERPASLVKELIENSLDAGSTQIEILIEGGGIERVCLSDDGSGMAREDLVLAIRKHTTSKIRSEEDLFNIQTLGFRGEALASIVEVSRTSIVSRPEGSSEATRLDIEGGEIRSTRTDGRKVGTTVDVRDLFFNTPARRKFLKSEKTELSHIIKAVKHSVLAHPSVHFKLTHGAKVILDSPPASSLRDTVANLYSPELAKALLGVELLGNEIKIEGLIAPPDHSKSDRSEQFLYVNGRFIRDVSLNYAISRAFEGFIPAGRFPIAFLFVQINPAMIDVNVHPKKEEVRFSNLALVQAEVKRAVSNALLTRGVIPMLHDPTSPQQQWTGETPSQMHFQSGHSGRGLQRRPPELDLKRELLSRATARPHVQDSIRESAQPESQSKHDRVIGQLHGTYIIVQTEQGIELIDQHVAHERIFFEKYLSQLTAGRIARQRLLIPMTLEFPLEEAELLEKHLPQLYAKLGVGIERFGSGTFIIRDWPESFAKSLTKEGAMRVLERVLQALEHDAHVELADLAKEMAADLACESAVVKNTQLNREEMEALLAQLRQTENPYRCPHGRPIIVAYSLVELEKAFGRR